jgi:hypothetical protein
MKILSLTTLLIIIFINFIPHYSFKYSKKSISNKMISFKKFNELTLPNIFHHNRLLYNTNDDYDTNQTKNLSNKFSFDFTSVALILVIIISASRDIWYPLISSK